MSSGFRQMTPIFLIGAGTVSKLCTTPYPNHPKGCPNWGKKEGCPPRCPSVFDVLDLNKPTFVIYNIFDFAAHTAKMRARHPEWSQRQVECCLYWQGTARKSLRQEISRFLIAYPGLHVMMTPEGAGVNITATMELVGHKLEWPPVSVAYQVAVAGTPLREESHG